MQIVAPPPSRISGMTFDEIRFRGEGGNARPGGCAGTFTVFPRGFPLVTPIVIRVREGADNAKYILADTVLSSFVERIGKHRFRAGRIDRENRSNGRMTLSQFYNRANEREPRIASLNFCQAFMAKKEETRKITDFFYI